MSGTKTSTCRGRGNRLISPTEQGHFCEGTKLTGEKYPYDFNYPEDCERTVCQFCRKEEKACVLCGGKIRRGQERTYDGDAPCHTVCYDPTFEEGAVDGE